jgi:hypothetical protein
VRVVYCLVYVCILFSSTTLTVICVAPSRLVTNEEMGASRCTHQIPVLSSDAINIILLIVFKLTRTHTHAHSRTNTLTYTHTYTHTHTCIHILMNNHTHTHTHT